MGLALDEWQREILKTEGNILLCSGRQVGKSTIIAVRDGNYVINNPNKSVLIIAATERQANLIYQKVLMYIEQNAPNLIMKGRKRPTKNNLYLKNGSVVRCLPVGQSARGIRGFTINRLTADEAAFIPEDCWMALTPMLLTTGGDIALLSTPHGKAGYFYDRYNDPTFKVFHVNSEEVMKNREISESWTEKQRDKALEHLEREKKSMSALEYAQEYMGMFIDEFIQFFPDKLIRECMVLKRTGEINRRNNHYLGVDIARLGDDESTFEIFEKVNRDFLVQKENLVTTKTRLNQTYNKILELDRQYRFKEIYIDDGGIGCAVFDWLLEHDQTKRKVIAINNRERVLDRDEKHKKKILKEDLYNNLLMLMEQKRIQLLDDDEIFLSLKSVQYEYITSAKATTKLKIFGSYTHITEGLIRAAWCLKDKTLNIWCK